MTRLEVVVQSWWLSCRDCHCDVHGPILNVPPHMHVQLGWGLQWKQKQNNLRMSTFPCASQWCLPHILVSLDTQSHVTLLVYISIESLERLTIKGTGYTRERWNASQKIDSQRATEFAMNYSSCRLYIAAKNAVKVHAIVLDANMRHWHLYTRMQLFDAYMCNW